MLKQHATFLRASMIFVDMSIAAISFLIAYAIGNQTNDLYPLSRYVWVIPFLSVCWGGTLAVLGMYKSFRFKNVFQILFPLVCAPAIVFLLFTSAIYIFKFLYFSRSLIGWAFILTIVLIGLEKACVILVMNYLRRKGLNFRNVLIVGTGPRARAFIKQITSHQESGLKIIGLVDTDSARVGTYVEGHEVVGTLEDIQEILWSQPIDNVFFIVPRSSLSQIENQLLCCETLGISFSIAMDLFDMQFTMGRPDSVLTLPVVTFESISQKHYQLIAKRIMDVAASALALIVLSPLFAAVAIMIKFTSKGPVIFSQVRCSVNGRRFKLYKFRTMQIDAEAKLKELMAHNEMGGPAFKMENDPRVTPIGRFLRKFSLDELPQLWNVVTGSMSLVGPRPPLPDEVSRYGLWHRRRLSMRPGITCLWQVSGRNRITDFDEWAKLDLKYIDEWSFALDLNILLRTVPAVLSTAGAK